MTKKAISTLTSSDEPGNKVAEAILGFIGQIPRTDEAKSHLPAERSRSIASSAATKAAITAGTLALPPGPLGWLTILPELIAIWKIQAQMVADIAGTYGKQTFLTREQMLHCLFRHTAAQAVRDLVVRVGERFLVRRVSLRAFQTIARKVGVRITQRVIGKSISRWLPIIGALGVGAYAYYDTGQVAQTAIELFEGEIEIEPEPETQNENG
ncbi:MAG: EcsC family protein [Candidatus Binatia bacterium]